MIFMQVYSIIESIVVVHSTCHLYDFILIVCSVLNCVIANVMIVNFSRQFFKQLNVNEINIDIRTRGVKTFYSKACIQNEVRIVTSESGDNDKPWNGKPICVLFTTVFLTSKSIMLSCEFMFFALKFQANYNKIYFKTYRTCNTKNHFGINFISLIDLSWSFC